MSFPNFSETELTGNREQGLDCAFPKRKEKENTSRRRVISAEPTVKRFCGTISRSQVIHLLALAHAIKLNEQRCKEIFISAGINTDR